MMTMRWILVFTLLWPAVSRGAEVLVQRLESGVLQPQAVVDRRGTVHLVYFKGDPRHGDLFYVRSTDGAATFSAPIRVNNIDGGAIAIGTIRGAQLVVGRNGRAHVAWNGTDLARKALGTEADPVCYARLNDRGDAFEPQVNLIRKHWGLDGGGSIAADENSGDVFVAWHAPEDAKHADEATRRVWMVKSTDDGQTFGEESAASADVGVCGCCGMRIFAAGDGKLLGLFRSASQKVNRDTYLLTSRDGAEHFQQAMLAPMRSGTCIMSSAAIVRDAHHGKLLAAFETSKGQIELAWIDPQDMKVMRRLTMSGEAGNRKHPAIAVNRDGRIFVAWAEVAGCGQGGRIAWQIIDSDGHLQQSGRADDALPAWSMPAVVARGDDFILVY